VVENYSGFVKGFAMLYYAPDINFCFLDYIATSKDVMAGGIGSALYEKVREESQELGSAGLVF
jgi:N-acetylglutamate synthase-like GNAT family acetyltransferase